MSESPRIVVDLEFLARPTRAADIAQRWLGWHTAIVPDLPGEVIRRWLPGIGWAPPGTRLLQRHVHEPTMRFAVTPDGPPSPEWRAEYNLGLVHVFAQPGTLRLFEHDGRFALTDDEDEFADTRRPLGFVEQAGFPMLDRLERRRYLETGQEILVGGERDHLFALSEPLEHLGYIEHFTIHPQPAILATTRYGWSLLWRWIDLRGWSHRYAISEKPPAPDAVCLGQVALRPSRNAVPVLTRGGGLEILAQGADPSPALAEQLRWAVAPAKWAPELGEPRLGSVRERLRRLRSVARWPGPPVGDAVRGYLRSATDDGFEPLYLATHPVTGDRFVSRSEFEARDMGYRLDGVLGYSGGSAHETPEQPLDVPWASRFGRGRRKTDPSLAQRVG